jgi:hypothetical protein
MELEGDESVLSRYSLDTDLQLNRGMNSSLGVVKSGTNRVRTLPAHTRKTYIFQTLINTSI